MNRLVTNCFGAIQECLLCDEHLQLALEQTPLREGERVLPADDGCECEECRALRLSR